MEEAFHLLEGSGYELPASLNNPFSYTPHPLCMAAARRVCAYLDEQSEWSEELAAGKMLGVLVCQDDCGRLGFLAAYSGQLGGREDWPWFVPAVFDYLQPTGYFKGEEAAISAINHRIEQLEQSAEMKSAKAAVQQLRQQEQEELAAYKQMMQAARERRHLLRQAGDDREELTRESQFQKAELRRLKARWSDKVEEAERRLMPLEDSINALKEERKRRSDALQRWLFDQFLMQNVKGERRTLTSIFAPTAQGVPPSGAGECCAPKLLQYAFTHGLRPLAIAEFWQGRSPRMEVRHHGQYYPACRGKCKPILEWMLDQDGLADGQPQTEAQSVAEGLSIVYEDSCLVVVNKPAGLLSVRGKTGGESVESLLRARYGRVFMVHRLDQDTSGLLVVALTVEAYHALQPQFMPDVEPAGNGHCRVSKKYMALLEGVVHGHGTISLPLRPDLTDRPRQVVDHAHGKEAVTDYEVLSVADGLTRIALIPRTGRTHQLRMHCAHAEGLATPIVGDRLYGKPAQRLCLHAAELAFYHPMTGERMHFTSPVPF